jgi:hypothetical protein
VGAATGTADLHLPAEAGTVAARRGAEVRRSIPASNRRGARILPARPSSGRNRPTQRESSALQEAALAGLQHPWLLWWLCCWHTRSRPTVSQAMRRAAMAARGPGPCEVALYAPCRSGGPTTEFLPSACAGWGPVSKFSVPKTVEFAKLHGFAYSPKDCVDDPFVQASNQTVCQSELHPCSKKPCLCMVLASLVRNMVLITYPSVRWVEDGGSDCRRRGDPVGCAVRPCASMRRLESRRAHPNT